jgi:hypothetical protein
VPEFAWQLGNSANNLKAPTEDIAAKYLQLFHYIELTVCSITTNFIKQDFPKSCSTCFPPGTAASDQVYACNYRRQNQATPEISVVSSALNALTSLQDKIRLKSRTKGVKRD